MYTLYIANKVYSSWSLRPWIMMREMELLFEEKLVNFGPGSNWENFRKFSPVGKVPCLHDGESIVWDSLAIIEYLADRHPGVWPQDPKAWGFPGVSCCRARRCGSRCRPRAQPPSGLLHGRR